MLPQNANSLPRSGRPIGCRRVFSDRQRVLTELEAVEAVKELKALQRRAFEIVEPNIE
jgi:hypothetical protein